MPWINNKNGNPVTKVDNKLEIEFFYNTNFVAWILNITQLSDDWIGIHELNEIEVEMMLN
jgi:hypothetical protein